MEVPSYDSDNCFSGSYEHNLYSSPESVTVSSSDINCEGEQPELSLDYMEDLEYSLLHAESTLLNVDSQQCDYPLGYLQDPEDNHNFYYKSRHLQKREVLNCTEQAGELLLRMENCHEHGYESLNLQFHEPQTLHYDKDPLNGKVDFKSTEIDLTNEKGKKDSLDSIYFVSVEGAKDWLITNNHSVNPTGDFTVSSDNVTNTSCLFATSVHKTGLLCESDSSFTPIINRPPPPPYRPPSKKTSAIRSVCTDSNLVQRYNLLKSNTILTETACVGRKTPPPPYCSTNSASRKSGSSNLQQDLPTLSLEISDGATKVEKDNYLNFFPVAEFGDPFSEERLLSSDGLPTPPIEITADRRVVFPPRWEISSMPTPPTDDEAGGIEPSFPLDGERFSDDGEELPEETKPMVPADPKQWKKEHVTKWFEFCQSHKDFELGEIDKALLPENGNDLCQLTFDDFICITSTKESAEKLVQYLAKLLEGSGHSPTLLLQTISKSEHGVNEMSFHQQQNSNTKLHLIKELYGKYFTKENKASQTNGGGGQIQLWQFLLQLLFEAGNSSIITWDGDDGEFRLINPEEVARRWGERKGKPNMNYDKLSRAIRYYYDKEMMTKVGGKRYTYRFDYEGLMRMCQPTGISDTCFIQPGFVPDSSNYNMIRNFSFHGVFSGKGRKT